MNKIVNWPDDLELSIRAMAALRQLGVTSAAELLDVREGDVRSLRNAGGKTWREIAEAQNRVLRELAETHADRPRQSEPPSLDDAELRDEIAIRVFAGLLTGLWSNPDRRGPTPEAMATEAYLYADALIAARNNGAQA